MHRRRRLRRQAARSPSDPDRVRRRCSSRRGLRRTAARRRRRRLPDRRGRRVEPLHPSAHRGVALDPRRPMLVAPRSAREPLQRPDRQQPLRRVGRVEHLDQLGEFVSARLALVGGVQRSAHAERSLDGIDGPQVRALAWRRAGGRAERQRRDEQARRETRRAACRSRARGGSALPTRAAGRHRGDDSAPACRLARSRVRPLALRPRAGGRGRE